MKEKIKAWLFERWQQNRGACLGCSAGAILAIAILLFGFWRTFFVVLCGGVGLYLGRKSDRDPEFFGRLADDFLDRLNRLR
ncbi:DUF2273 domain-containing protein [uncultured Mitsuokella sp.]|uniref:DUF2273 domain-containing protein n=1 Tax=uncultured Mitsuokella sp. TaxID=453120 RepID=UPI0026706551|nr:DUF2273 domain-containing protein [uncultured Mitsuokella sp.]